MNPGDEVLYNGEIWYIVSIDRERDKGIWIMSFSEDGSDTKEKKVALEDIKFK